MSRIKGKGTKPELILRKHLWSESIRYRLNVSSLPGSPEILIRKHKIAVFVDSEFWHGYNWEEKKQKIKSNREFWIPKIERNIQRTQEVNFMLKALGFTVVRLWENEIKKNPEKCVNKIRQWFR